MRKDLCKNECTEGSVEKTSDDQLTLFIRSTFRVTNFIIRGRPFPPKHASGNQSTTRDYFVGSHPGLHCHTAFANAV